MDPNTVLDILNKIGRTCYFDIVIGYNKDFPNPCVCVLKDKVLVDKIESGLAEINQIGYRDSHNDIAKLFHDLSIALGTIVLVAYSEQTDIDMVVLFNNYETVNAIAYKSKI